MNIAGNYIIYEDWRTKWAVIHAMSCSRVGQHGGISRTYPPGTWYSGPFDTQRQAQWKINSDRAGWTQGFCSTCGVGAPTQ